MSDDRGGLVLTCGVCGFKGTDETFIPHDCYWVLRHHMDAVALVTRIGNRIVRPASERCGKKETD